MFSKLSNLFKTFFSKYYSLFLVLVVIVSYGQMLWMQPWEDDNALFFKLAHIQEPAGFIGRGVFGEGIYKYGVVPFVPIHKFFGYNTVAYFTLLLILYLTATLVVYKVFSYILGVKAGKVAGFIFAAGYLTSDGFWRMANSAMTSISIILISLFAFLYWKYYKEKRIRYYLLALLTFFVAVQYSIVRDHYLFTVVLFFEFIFFAFKKPLLSIFYSLTRLAPFAYVFYHWVLLPAGSQAGGVRDFIFTVFKGQFSVFYGFFCSITNLMIPDYITNFIFNLLGRIGGSASTTLILAKIFLFALPALIIFLLLKGSKKKYILWPVFCLLLWVWLQNLSSIFSIPVLNPDAKQLFIVALGGVTTIIFIVILISLKKNNGLFLFLVLWLFANTAAYSTNSPTVSYDTVNRYLAHSFFAYVGVLGLLSAAFIKKGKISNIVYWLIIIFGVANIYHAVIYQNIILKTRSFLVRDFYLQLKSLLPVINKGDILFFDVSSNRNSAFRDAVAAAMMPNSTSFAWRYGIDRYDLYLVTSFSELQDLVRQNKATPRNIHSFWYSDMGLKDTSIGVRKYFFGNHQIFGSVINLPQISEAIIKNMPSDSEWQQPDIVFNFPEQIMSVAPIEVTVNLAATPLNGKAVKYPLYASSSLVQNGTFNSDQTRLALEYKLDMKNFVNNSMIKVSSNWQDRVSSNLIDGNVDTVWQPDRVLWQNKKEFAEVKLPAIEKINRFYWVSGTYRNAIPTKYQLSTSLNGTSWQNVILSGVQDFGMNHVVTFTPVTARYVKMWIEETLGGESPMIAELRAIPLELSDLDLTKADSFLEKPFSFVSNADSYYQTLLGLDYRAEANVYWLGDKEVGWQKASETQLTIIYDGKTRNYKATIPAGGSYIRSIKISDIVLPGKIVLNGIYTK